MKLAQALANEPEAFLNIIGAKDVSTLYISRMFGDVEQQLRERLNIPAPTKGKS